MFLVFSAHAIVCHTPQWRQHAGDRMSEYRPTSGGYVDSEVYPLRVHFRLEEDEQRVRDVVLPAAEYAWLVQVDQMGWPAPPTDGELGGSASYDIYLTDEETYGGAYTWGTGADTDETDNWSSQASYIAIDDGQRAINDELMPIFVAHEFNHALQYTIDAWELTLFPWESTAEAMEDLVYDDLDTYIVDIVDFQEFPFLSLLHDGYTDEVVEYDDYSYYEYGGSIWSTFLEERYGTKDGTFLLAFWEALAQPGRGEEPDFVDAITWVGSLEGGTAADVYDEFAEWRMFAAGRDDGAHFQEGGEWTANTVPGREGELPLVTIDGTSQSPADPPYELGVSYWDLEVVDAPGEVLEVTVTGEEGVSWSLIGIAWPESGPATVVRARAEETTPATIELPVAGAERLVVGVANLGRTTLDPDDMNARRKTFTLDFGWKVEVEDSGSEPVAEEEAGCACASGSANGGLAALVGGLALWRRRARLV